MSKFLRKAGPCSCPIRVLKSTIPRLELPLAEDSASLGLSDAILLEADVCCLLLPVLGGSGMDVFQDSRGTMRHSCF